jgi:hypothetical protein
VKVVNIVHIQWPINKRTSKCYINSSNASAFWAIFNRFARDFKAPPPYSAAASHFVMTPPPAIFCGRLASRPPVIFAPSQPYSGYVAAPGTICTTPEFSEEGSEVL